MLDRVHPVVLEMLLRGLAEIGEGWYRGKVAAQQEHFASVLAVRRLQTLIAASPIPTRVERIVLACPPGEQHTISLHVINLFLRRQGWEVVDLGANVPLDRLEPMLANLHPQLLIAAAQHLPTAQTLQALASTSQRLKVPLAYGGGVFNRLPVLRRRVAGHFLGESLGDAGPMADLGHSRVRATGADVPAIKEALTRLEGSAYRIADAIYAQQGGGGA